MRTSPSSQDFDHTWSLAVLIVEGFDQSSSSVLVEMAEGLNGKLADRPLADPTELIIFIRPRVIRDAAEARAVTAEFRRGLSIEAPHVRRGKPEPGDELMRIIN